VDLAVERGGRHAELAAAGSIGSGLPRALEELVQP
jgi:hypothetical protein